MLCRVKPDYVLLLGPRKVFLYIILVNRVQECVVHKMVDVRGGTKGNFMSRGVSMGRFRHTFRYANQNKKVI